MIVVGAGIAGLVCAIYLVRGGRKVLLLEHNHQAGGLMSGIWRKDFYFDCGDQSFETMGILFPLLEELGLYQEKDWQRTYYRIICPNFDVAVKSLDDLEKALIQGHPGDAKGIKAFIERLRSSANLWAKFAREGTLPYVKDGWKYNLKALVRLGRDFLFHRDGWNLARSQFHKYSSMVEQTLCDPDLISLFGRLGYRGWSEAYGTLFWYLWMKDYWYPAEGLQGFIDRLVGHFQSLGGEIQFKQRVDEILIRQGKAVGLRTKRNEHFYASPIVYCGDFKRLYTEMIPPSKLPPRWVKKVYESPLSEAMATVFLGVKMTHEELGSFLKTHHTFYVPSYQIKDVHQSEKDPSLHRNSWLEITWTSMNNPALAPAGMNSLVLQTMTPFSWQDFWQSEGNRIPRNKAYRLLKKEVMDEMIETCSKVIPGIKDKIIYQDMGTPLSAVRFTLNAEGATSSWSWDRSKALCGTVLPQLRTPIPHLYTAGHYTFWPGSVPLSAYSGRIVAKNILKRYYGSATDFLYSLYFKWKWS